MHTVTTIGLDLAKSVFQVHGVDAAGQVVIRRQLKRRGVLAFFQKLPPCLVGIEACASSHYWSRELLALGHSVRLMPPASPSRLQHQVSSGVTCHQRQSPLYYEEAGQRHADPVLPYPGWLSHLPAPHNCSAVRALLRSVNH